MNAVCAVCDLKFERAQGYWVGAIYVNYASTTLIAVGGFFLLRVWADLAHAGPARPLGAVRDRHSRCGSSATAAACGWAWSTG